MDYHLTINGLGGSNALENDSLFALVDSTSVIAGLRLSMPGPTMGLKQEKYTTEHYINMLWGRSMIHALAKFQRCYLAVPHIPDELFQPNIS